MEFLSPLPARPAAKQFKGGPEQGHILQRKAKGPAASEEAPPIVHDVLRAPGQPLDDATRGFMESRFDSDFGHVRIHSDHNAAKSASKTSAHAYTYGSHIVFGAGQYSPASARGVHLLAHELTHVLQQHGTGNQRRPAAVSSDQAMERQADESAFQVVSGITLSGSVSVENPGVIQKKDKRERLGVKIPRQSESDFKRISARFDGRVFSVIADGEAVMEVIATSGRNESVGRKEAQLCGGTTDEAYLNNPRYVGIKDFGPIPEGAYSFMPSRITLFSPQERFRLASAGRAAFQDVHGKQLSGGDWGAGRVPLTPSPGSPEKDTVCGDTTRRSGFFLHGGVLAGSAGCVDVGNSAFKELAQLVAGYDKPITLTVEYASLQPGLSFFDEAVVGMRSIPGRIERGIEAMREWWNE
jgi:hypothetical protein